MKKLKQDTDSKRLKYASTKLFLGNPDQPNQYFTKETKYGDLIKLDLNVTVENMLQRSNKSFGIKKPLVIIKMFYVTKVAFFSECFSQLKKCFCCSINSVLNFDLLYILYIDDEYVDESEDKIELEDSDDHSIMLELEGNTVDVMTKQNVVEQESVLQLLKHDSTEWFLGNPD